MKKRLFLSILAVILLLGVLTPAAYATALEDRHIADGSCGEGINWSLDGYTLTITGVPSPVETGVLGMMRMTG